MSELRARYAGPHADPAGVFLVDIPLANGEVRKQFFIPHGGEVPTEIDGNAVPAAYRDSLLEQDDNFVKVNRATGDETKGKTDKKDGEK